MIDSTKVLGTIPLPLKGEVRVENEDRLRHLEAVWRVIELLEEGERNGKYNKYVL